MPAPLFLSEPCEICGLHTTGRHFGVMSCRACASFFRRAENWKKDKKPCETDGSCAIFVNGKYPCKPCRLQKCYKVGMDSSRFQTNRDLISSSMKKVPESLATFLGRPAFILCCEPAKIAINKTFIDMTYLVDTAANVFQSQPNNNFRPFQYQNSLEKLALTLDDMRLKAPDERIAVEWFASFPEFNKLKNYIKLEIVKAAWIGWTRLEKLAETADYRRKHVLADNVYMLGDDTCLDFGSFEFDLTWCTNYTMEQLEFYISPQLEQYCQQCVQDLVELAPTNIELNYMLLQISLYHAGNKCQGKVLEACEKLMQTQADHLHDYYVNKKKQPYYSVRLAKMLKINKGIEADMRGRAERNQLARTFNVLKIEYSHPDMFDAN
ncbi:hypothetical protein L5515_006759 [Caenorhabditis briggsae]|uniref:Uncharacterized protein n=1 Tax=Caenorhabditis briggsae TaxID=6238 RepID=A0AAE9F563_CAEBR|nr:hypothetical protein L5515_006759 [Caenorhabditis briggsae]